MQESDELGVRDQGSGVRDQELATSPLPPTPIPFDSDVVAVAAGRGLWNVRRDIPLDGLVNEERQKVVQAMHSLILEAVSADEAEKLYRETTGYFADQLRVEPVR